MGVLGHGDERRTLSARCVVGRAPTCGLRLTERSVSGEHALVAWTGTGWEVRDLGSRNGTFVADARLQPGERRSITRGDAVRFGHTDTWVLDDAGPPVATARDPDTGEIREGDGSLLVLPTPDDPRVSVFEQGDGSWLAEIDGEPRAVQDGAPVFDGTRTWVLHLPTAIAQTWDAADQPWAIEDLSVALAHTPDEEHVEVTFAHPFGERRFKRYRVHHYLLLLLARAWLEDADATPDTRGWVYSDELCRMLQIDDLRLNVDIYRSRKELGALGVVGAAELIQRRRGTRQVRIGVHRLSVREL